MHNKRMMMRLFIGMELEKEGLGRQAANILGERWLQG
jgi:hypothetical protein